MSWFFPLFSLLFFLFYLLKGLLFNACTEFLFFFFFLLSSLSLRKTRKKATMLHFLPLFPERVTMLHFLLPLLKKTDKKISKKKNQFHVILRPAHLSTFKRTKKKVRQKNNQITFFFFFFFLQKKKLHFNSFFFYFIFWSVSLNKNCQKKRNSFFLLPQHATH